MTLALVDQVKNSKSVMENKNINQTQTDCRDEVGITVGLIDAIISIARILSKRDLIDSSIKEALKDLSSDEDVDFIIKQGKNEYKNN
jgi:hypothetical protein